MTTPFDVLYKWKHNFKIKSYPTYVAHSEIHVGKQEVFFFSFSKKLLTYI